MAGTFLRRTALPGGAGAGDLPVAGLTRPRQRPQIVEAFACSAGEHDVPLPRVKVERLLHMTDRLFGPTGDEEHFRQIHERIGAPFGTVCSGGKLDRLACKHPGFVELPPPREQLRPHSPPDDLRDSIVARGVLLALASKLPRFIAKPACAQDIGELSSERRKPRSLASARERATRRAKPSLRFAEVAC